MEGKKKNWLFISAVVVVWVAVIVTVDVLFFKDRFWERLIANVGICLVFGAIYLIFRKGR